VDVGVALSAITFVLVSRMTKPTPSKNLRIFFDDRVNATNGRSRS
jgi:hypothetical protein